MEPVDVQGLLAVGEAAVKKIDRSRADSGEAFVQSGWGRSISLDGGSIKYGEYGGEFGIGLRVIKDGRLGFSYCTRPRDVPSAIRAALSLSRIAPPTGLAFPSPSRPRRPAKTYDKRILSIDDGQALDWVRDMMDGGREASPDLSFPGGGVGFGTEAFCVVNTQGASASDEGTSIAAGLSTTLGKEGSSDVSTGSYDDSSRTLSLDVHDIGRRAAQLAVDSHGARALDRGGPMDVVMVPDAFSELVEHLVAPAFHGDRVLRGESPYSTKRGEACASSGLTIVDDGLLSDGPNTASIDDEGVPSSRRTLMKGGVVKGFLYDAASAEEAGARTTSSGMRVDRYGSDRSFKVVPACRARNVVLKWDRRVPADDLVGEVRDGVLVHELLGSHTANRISGDFSITSSLLFRIRKGEVREPLKGVMLAGNMFVALKEMGGLADDYRNVGGSLSSVAVRTPTAWLRNINVLK